MSQRRKSLLVPGALVAAITVVAGCSSPPSTTPSTGASSTTPTTVGTASATGSPGVTATSINVGAISTRTGAIAADFDGLVPGVQAYFDMINAEGGINGRKLNLAYDLDDGGQASQFTQDTHTLIDQDHAFAAMVASYWFTPNYFVETKTPTYGYNVSGNWSDQPNLFAAGGSVQNDSSQDATVAFLMKQTKSTNAAVISYGPAITSSYNACNAWGAGLKEAGYNVTYEDLGAQLGGSYSSAVQRMQQSGTQFVFSCMQDSDNVTMARDIQQYGLKINQLWVSGYDQSLLNQYSNLMQGVIVNLTGVVPYEAVKYPDTYTGMVTYVNEMNKYEPAFTFNGVASQGWQSAALLAEAIRQAGNNLTQANIINITNKITNFTAGGLTTVTNWESAHSKTTYPICNALVEVHGKTFTSVFVKGSHVFVCLAEGVKNPVPVTPPPGTPGA
jgi:branched-chain amino acid transport system substrate-binding protein